MKNNVKGSFFFFFRLPEKFMRTIQALFNEKFSFLLKIQLESCLSELGELGEKNWELIDSKYS